MVFGEKLFREYWHLACHRRELPHDGDFIKLETPVGDIVIFNDGGNLVAFDNRCPHRGSLMYEGTHGNQAATCRYHGWTFRNDRVIVPHREQFEACAIANVDLHRYRLEWCADFLFVGVEPRLNLYAQLDDVASTLEEISFNIDRSADVNTYEFQCAWQIAVENALEPYHIDLVHPQTLAQLKLDEGVNAYHGRNSIWKAEVNNTHVKRLIKSLGRYFTLDYQFEGYMSIYMFPFSMISSTYGLSYSVQNYFPSKRAEKTNFLSRLLTANIKPGSAAAILAPFFESTANVNRKVFEEDHAICTRVPADTWSSAPLKYPARTEEKIAHFRSLCADALKQG